MTPLQPDQPLTATLTAQQWNVVLAALGEMPAKHSMTVIQSLLRQMPIEEPPPQQRGNGVDDHVSDR